jgi:hypothetical protein
MSEGMLMASQALLCLKHIALGFVPSLAVLFGADVLSSCIFGDEKFSHLIEYLYPLYYRTFDHDLYARERCR